MLTPSKSTEVVLKDVYFGNGANDSNSILGMLKKLWNDTQISIVNNILQQVESDTNNRSEWLYSLDIILSSKEKNVSELIQKTTTQLI